MSTLPEFVDQKDEKFTDTIRRMLQDDAYSYEEPFVVTNLTEAMWCVDLIRSAQTRIDERKTVVDIEIAKLTDRIAELQKWLEEDSRDDRSTIAKMETLLRPWAASRIQDTLKKSCTVPGATLRFRAGGSEYRRDANVILQWARSNGMNDYIRTTESLAWDDLKSSCKVVNGKLIAPTGEIVPTVEIVERGEQFSVVLGKEEPK